MKIKETMDLLATGKADFSQLQIAKDTLRAAGYTNLARRVDILIKDYIKAHPIEDSGYTQSYSDFITAAKKSPLIQQTTTKE